MWSDQNETPSHEGHSHHIGYRGKRLLDCIIALVGLLLATPIMLVLVLLVRWTIGSPVLFQQLRPGLNGKPFKLYKFRTMIDKVDARGESLPDGQRLTTVGRLLRGTSLDELPELLNVLKGDMSLVGPRPLLMRYMPYYTEREKARHLVRPGITGWAQINGRNEACWNDRLERDVWYTENISFLLDVSILLKTFVKVLKRSGIVVDARSIMQNLDEERTPGHQVD